MLRLFAFAAGTLLMSQNLFADTKTRATNVAEAALLTEVVQATEFPITFADFSYTSATTLRGDSTVVQVVMAIDAGVVCKGKVIVSPELDVVEITPVFGGWCADIP
jgi:hypothetical protein